MLRSVGVDVETDGNQVCLRPASRMHPIDIEVPGDPSSAAFFVALAALASKGELVLTDVCLNPTRNGFFDVMTRIGAKIDVISRRDSGGEVVGSLRVEPGKLSNATVGGSDIGSIIDELPLLACVAAGAGIELEITGAEELRVKESDRIAVVVQNLRAVGANAEELPDGLRVHHSARRLSGTIDPRGDHRIAMAFGILSAVSGGNIEISNPECVAVSYPGFWSDLRGAVA
jgi:3-phosphoshikimate 1-carboxyvinyltransferase